MASNYAIKDAYAAVVVMAGLESGGVQTPIHYALQSGTWTTTPSLSTNGVGGLSPYNIISAASNNATSVKGSPATLGSVVATNNNTTNIAYLKLYNKAIPPTVGTDIPVQVYALQANGGGVAITFPGGMNFSTGLAFAITNSMDNSNTSVALNQVAVSLGCK